MFGLGLSITHYESIVANSNATVGKGCRILVDTVIGQTKGKEFVPVIVDYCYIGAGAKIVGKLRIGDGVIIGVNAVVTKNVPDHVAVAGVPSYIFLNGHITHHKIIFTEFVFV